MNKKVKGQKMKSRIYLLRKKLGLSQIEFARELNISQATLSRHERNDTLPYEFLDTIHKRFNVDLNWLVAGHGDILKIDGDTLKINDDVLKNNDKMEKMQNYFFRTASKRNKNLLADIIDTHFIFNVVTKRQNRNQLYFMALEENGINRIAEKVRFFLENSEYRKKHILLYCNEKTEKEILLLIAKYLKMPMTKNIEITYFFNVFKEALYYDDKVFVFVELSKSKIKNVEGLYRSIIKIIDDAHFKDISPQSNIIFIDYASFLEKHYDYIGTYLDTNLILG